MYSEIEKFVQESPSQRRAALALEVSRLRDRHDDLMADQARMVHASEMSGKLIAQALCENLERLNAARWQLHEEDRALGALSEEWERCGARVVCDAAVWF